jgi:dephospho-CoA kinase
MGRGLREIRCSPENALHDLIRCRGVFAGKPIIGLAGGIGSGKSTIAGLFGEMGCLVLSADDAVRDAYRDPAVKSTLRTWWGNRVFDSYGEFDRRALARIVFENPDEKRRLEGLIHPIVAAKRQGAMEAAAGDAQVLAFVWDIPLLFEVGLDRQCDAIVFVDAPFEQRLRRVQATRGWDENELRRREKLQRPLDNKREMSNYIVQNTADVGFARKQVRDVLCAILAGQSGR